MPSPWISHVKAYCAKYGCSYKEGLSKARASYKPVRGGYREPMPRAIGSGFSGGAMKLAELKSKLKSMGHKLSRVVNGVRKAYNKNELVKMLVDKGVEGAVGGKVKRMKKAKKWTDFAVATAKKGIDLAKEVGLGGKADGKVNRMRKAQKWTDYAVSTAKKGIGLAKEMKDLM